MQIELNENHKIDVEHGEDFISVYSNVFPEGYCQHMIKEFDRVEAEGAGWSRSHENHIISDYAIIVMPGIHNLTRFNSIEPVSVFFKGLQVVFENYAKKYSYLKSVAVKTTTMKMQRTDPSEGYHMFHAEAGPQTDFVLNQNRAVVYSLYLNTLEPDAGGETEFLYQKRRIKAEENTMVIWPASYTHVHRGNTVLGNKSKYIITGWFFYADE